MKLLVVRFTASDQEGLGNLFVNARSVVSSNFQPPRNKMKRSTVDPLDFGCNRLQYLFGGNHCTFRACSCSKIASVVDSYFTRKLNPTLSVICGRKMFCYNLIDFHRVVQSKLMTSTPPKPALTTLKISTLSS